MGEWLFELVERGKDGWEDAVIKALRGSAGASNSTVAVPPALPTDEAPAKHIEALKALGLTNHTYQNTLLMVVACKKCAGPVLQAVLNVFGEGERAGGGDKGGYTAPPELVSVVNLKNTFGETALHRVAQATQLDDPTKAQYAMQLLRMGADRAACTQYVNKTPAQVAKSVGALKMVQILEEWHIGDPDPFMPAMPKPPAPAPAPAPATPPPPPARANITDYVAHIGMLHSNGNGECEGGEANPAPASKPNDEAYQPQPVRKQLAQQCTPGLLIHRNVCSDARMDRTPLPAREREREREREGERERGREKRERERGREREREGEGERAREREEGQM